MPPERALTRLVAYHEQITSILAGARQLLNGSGATQMKALALARWQLLRVLREYQLFKHTEVFDPIITAGPSLRSSAAELIKARCVEFATIFNNHVQRWSLDGPATAWPNYRAEALEIAEKIELHLQREKRDINALLHGLSRTRGKGTVSGDQIQLEASTKV